MSTTVHATTLRELVEHELSFDPQVTSTSIGVTTKDGVVTLSGFVATYSERLAAEHAALRVQGCRAVANDLQVRLATGRIDPDIASDAADALTYNLNVPTTVKVSVRDGIITLEGTCEWYYQRNGAEKAVRHIAGVKNVSNEIVIKPRISPQLVRDKIQDALRRSAQIDADRIKVTAMDSRVTLSGNVRSAAERAEAERAAWSAPGVAMVDNRIVVTP